MDRFEKQIELRAPRSRVWRAISSPVEFGTWFGLGDNLTLEGDFVPGAKIFGVWNGNQRELFCVVEEVVPERLVAFRWVPYEVPAGDDPATHPMTRIEMRLEDTATGTRLSISEAGFDKLPADKQYKRDQNAEGWTAQLQSIAQHILGGITVSVETRIARPVAEVFDAIVDPTRMAHYFISRGSAPLVEHTTVEWEWADVGAKLRVNVHAVEAPRRIMLSWSASGAPTKVILTLAPDGDGTRLVANEAPFPLSEEAAARAVRQTQGWTDFGLPLKAYLVHRIDLRHGVDLRVS